MPVRKRFFVNDIAKKIKKDLIDKNSDLDDLLQTVIIGNLDLMPSPETLSHRDTALRYLPAVYIMPNDVLNTTVNANKSISSGRYSFLLRYVHYFDVNDTTNVMEKAIAGAELVAETLLEDHNLVPTNSGTEYVELQDNNGNPIGHILNTEVHRIEFNTIDSEVFRGLKIPVILIDIDYEVVFRSLFVKGGVGNESSIYVFGSR